jgi:hypothetical protein
MATATACCPNPDDDGSDHPLTDGVFFFVLILAPVVLWAVWKLVLGRTYRRRPPK